MHGISIIGMRLKMDLCQLLWMIRESQVRNSYKLHYYMYHSKWVGFLDLVDSISDHIKYIFYIMLRSFAKERVFVNK
jgi:hypothetical protein